MLWEFCLRHPEVRDVCDIGQMLFWNKKWAWWATAVMFILNNTVCARLVFADIIHLGRSWLGTNNVLIPPSQFIQVSRGYRLNVWYY